MQEFIVPASLKQGDRIAIISPSYALAADKMELARQTVLDWGFIPVESSLLPDEPYLGKYAGSVSERLEDLMWAITNPDIKAIFCVRGGYGSLHLAELIPLDILRANPKWLVGFSDITGIHALESLAGVMSIHGPMGSSFHVGGGKDISCKLLRNLLGGKFPSYTIEADIWNIPGEAKGRLVGGNLSTLYPLIGTKYDPTACADEIILFIEEIEESYHNIDRMLNVIRLHGGFDKVKGIIAGQFTACPADLGYSCIQELLDDNFSSLSIPVCYGFPAGHESNNFPLIEGCMTELTVNAQGSTIKFK